MISGDHADVGRAEDAGMLSRRFALRLSAWSAWSVFHRRFFHWSPPSSGMWEARSRVYSHQKHHKNSNSREVINAITMVMRRFGSLLVTVHSKSNFENSDQHEAMIATSARIFMDKCCTNVNSSNPEQRHSSVIDTNHDETTTEQWGKLGYWWR